MRCAEDARQRLFLSLTERQKAEAVGEELAATSHPRFGAELEIPLFLRLD